LSISKSHMHQAAFSLIELVAVLVIVGVLAVFAMPRFAGIDPFAERGFFEEALAATRYAQKLAVASGCSIRVNFDAGSNSLDISRWTGGANCTQLTPPIEMVQRPGGDAPFQSNAPSGVNVGNDLAFYFDRVGRPHDLSGNLITDPADLDVVIGPRRLQVTPDTGLVLEN
jgi:MSHA pilin protein MshC